jgi:predicted enzyme related to lactoylglutathione lyase
MTKSAVSSVTLADPVTWFEVLTPDPKRAKAFYGSMFGWTFTDDESGYILIGQGDAAAIGGGMAQTPPQNQPRAVFNVQVADVEATCARAAQVGGTVVMPPQTAPTGLRFAYIADPDGSTLGVWTPPA